MILDCWSCLLFQICFQVVDWDSKPSSGSISSVPCWWMEMLERYCCEVQKGCFLFFLFLFAFSFFSLLVAAVVYYVILILTRHDLLSLNNWKTVFLSKHSICLMIIFLKVVFFILFPVCFCMSLFCLIFFIVVLYGLKTWFCCPYTGIDLEELGFELCLDTDKNELPPFFFYWTWKSICITFLWIKVMWWLGNLSTCKT